MKLLRIPCVPKATVLMAWVFSLAGMAMPALALDISGASTLQPMVSKLGVVLTQNGGEAVKVAGDGSGAGVKNALAGTSQIGMVSRNLPDTEKASLKYATIGIDALAMVVHQSNLAYRTGPVTACQQLFADLGPIRAHGLGGLLYVESRSRSPICSCASLRSL